MRRNRRERPTRTTFYSTAIVLVGPPAGAAAQIIYGGNDPRGASTAAGVSLPLEPGQGAFAALAEIAAILSADPETDWSRVDLDALRAHLGDMDLLVPHARVEARPVKGRAGFEIALEGAAGGAVSRMVPAHGPILAAATGWSTELERAAGAIALTVTTRTEAEAERIRGLGFFGLMATGGHHPAHNLAIAAAPARTERGRSTSRPLSADHAASVAS